MKVDRTYILNPAYYLRNDLRRAIIGTYDFPHISQDLYERNILSIIHPYQAQMLSFFDGSRSLKECIYSIADFFGLNIENVTSFIGNYIENPNGTTILHDSHYYLLPKNLLIEKKEHCIPEIYKPEDFDIDEDLDFDSVRLYKPIKLIIETNLNCYTDCEYCYADRLNPQAGKLISLENLLGVISEAKKMKMPSIEINGGEVLLHPHASEILSHLDKNGYHPLISTKLPLTKDKLLFLRRLCFTHIQISIDTLDELELCRRLKVKTGYRDKMLNTMDLLDELDFCWQVNIVLTKDNIDIQKHIEPLLTALLKYKSIQSIKLAPVGFPMYKEDALFSMIRPSMKALNDIKDFITQIPQSPNCKIIYDIPTCTNQYRLINMSDYEKRNRCVANQSGLVILPNGDVTICEELYWQKPFTLGNITTSSLEEIWNSPKAHDLFYIMQDDVNRKSNCKKCNIFTLCRHNKGVCWKMVTMAYGIKNWDYPDPSCPNSNAYLKEFTY